MSLYERDTDKSSVINSEASETKYNISRWTSDGYVYLSDGEEIAYEHHLVAIADGADPYEVFGDDSKHVHHLTHRRLNLLSTVEVIDDETHREMHFDGLGYWFERDDGIPRKRTGGRVCHLMNDDKRTEVERAVEGV